MNRPIRSYLPDPELEKNKEVVLQARVPVTMRRYLKMIADKNHWSASQVIRAGLEKFIDDELPRDQRKLA